VEFLAEERVAVFKEALEITKMFSGATNDPDMKLGIVTKVKF
jgi:hypothetical protein